MAAHAAVGLSAEAIWELDALEAEAKVGARLVAASQAAGKRAVYQEAAARVEMMAAAVTVEEVAAWMAEAQAAAWAGDRQGSSSHSMSRQCCCSEHHTERSQECLRTAGHLSLRMEMAAMGRSQLTSWCEIAGMFGCGSKQDLLPPWRVRLRQEAWLHGTCFRDSQWRLR